MIIIGFLINMQVQGQHPHQFLLCFFVFVFVVAIVALELQMKSTLKAYDHHVTTTCSNFKMATHRG